MDGFPQQVPSYVKYDFLLTLIGLIILSYLIYLYWVIKIVINPVVYYLLLLVGLVFFYSGINEMKDNYFMEKEIKNMEYALRKAELKRKLNDSVVAEAKPNRTG